MPRRYARRSRKRFRRRRTYRRRRTFRRRRRRGLPSRPYGRNSLMRNTIRRLPSYYPNTIKCVLNYSEIIDKSAPGGVQVWYGNNISDPNFTDPQASGTIKVPALWSFLNAAYDEYTCYASSIIVMPDIGINTNGNLFFALGPNITDGDNYSAMGERGFIENPFFRTSHYYTLRPRYAKMRNAAKTHLVVRKPSSVEAKWANFSSAPIDKWYWKFYWNQYSSGIPEITQLRMRVYIKYYIVARRTDMLTVPETRQEVV